MSNEIEYRPEIIQYLKDMVAKCKFPDAPDLIAGDLEMSMNDYLEQVENKTEVGISIYRALEREYDSNIANSQSQQSSS